ncbi:WD repeat-containing and planar cell polarity effector protein fritz domain-containing protein [Phthorimaea operculella]|nr:WD repeat-containing and planar cell polarity effector protein fritz domain-containing protein [Phthorimaea operculella]
MFNYEVKFLTCDETLHLKNGDFKSYKYETKKRSDESVYDSGKRSYCERRGGCWRAPRPRQIRQLESKLRDRGVVYSTWTNENLITIVFSSGAIAYLTVKLETLDVTQILFDRYCVGKISNPVVSSVVMCKSHLLFVHADRVATLVSFGKTASTQPCRISDRDPHIQSIELGGAARRTERKLSWCENGAGVRVAVWGASAVEPAPWSPALEDLANLHLYQLTGPHVTLVAYHQLENDTLAVELSQKSDNIIHVIEQIASHKNGVTLNWLRYEVPTSEDRISKLSWVATTAASLPAWVRAVRLAASGDRALAACIDGSVHVVHSGAGLLRSTSAGIPTDVRWAGDIVLAAEEGGRLQCYDRALSLLNHHTKCLDFASYFRDPKRLQMLATTSVKGGCLVLVSFSGGPLALLRVMHPKILTSWIRSGRTNNAVALLRTLDWETEGIEGLWAVNRIVCDALRSGLQGGADNMWVAENLVAHRPDDNSLLLQSARDHDWCNPVETSSVQINNVVALLRTLDWETEGIEGLWAVNRIVCDALRSGLQGGAALLRTLDWETEGIEGLWAVNRIVCDALRSGLQGGAGETAAQAALGAYLAPLAPHGAGAERLAPALHDLARKFFHHLLRRGRIEKAMSLAVDLADWDLFADAGWAAARQGQQALADEATSLAAHYAGLQGNHTYSAY